MQTNNEHCGYDSDSLIPLPASPLQHPLFSMGCETQQLKSLAGSGLNAPPGRHTTPRIRDVCDDEVVEKLEEGDLGVRVILIAGTLTIGMLVDFPLFLAFSGFFQSITGILCGLSNRKCI